MGATKGRLFRARELLKSQFMQISELEIQVESERKEKMHKVEIVDLINILGGVMAVLLDEDQERWLPVFVDEFVGKAIAMGIKGYSQERPQTHDFIGNILEAAKVEVQHVCIESLKKTVYYAVVKVRNGDLEAEIDARPSDSIALALRTNAPIYVSDEVMEKASRELDKELRDHLGEGIESIIMELDAGKRMAEHAERLTVKGKKKAG